MWIRAAGACEVTGIPFSLDRGESGRRPYAPSLDRRDSSGGYTSENCRLVCVAVNVAMNEWGAELLLRIAEHVSAMTEIRRNIGTSNILNEVALKLEMASASKSLI